MRGGKWGLLLWLLRLLLSVLPGCHLVLHLVDKGRQLVLSTGGSLRAKAGLRRDGLLLFSSAKGSRRGRRVKKALRLDRLLKFSFLGPQPKKN